MKPKIKILQLAYMRIHGAPEIISKNTTQKNYSAPQNYFRLGTFRTPAWHHISIVAHFRKLLKHTYKHAYCV